MAEYIDIDAPIDVAVYQRNRRIQVTLRQILESNDVKYEPADVRPVVFCRDCQNSYEWANVDGDNYRYCGYLRSRWNHDADRMVDDDDFCKWGRKRANDV